MTLSSLSSTQRTAPQEDFDTDKVRTLIAEYLGIDVRRVTDEAHFSDELGADWLDRLELMILIEDEFVGVEITDDDADQIEVVGDLIRHIEITNNEQRAVKSSKCRASISQVLADGIEWHCLEPTRPTTAISLRLPI
jgi:acyl carrier protein